jgi:hypothetical protein
MHSKRTVAPAAVLIAIGAFLRLYGLEWMEFKGDEQEALTLGTNLIRDHPWSSAAPWPAHGMISSAQVHNAPLFTWIVALFWALTHHPVGVAALIALVNTFCLIPLWLWARRHMDEGHALLTLAVVAVSPFSVAFSRKIWTQDLLILGVLGVLWGVEWVRGTRPWRGVAMLGIGVLLAGQLHQSGPIALAMLVIAFGLQWLVDARAGRALRFPPPSRTDIATMAFVVAINVFFWWPYVAYLTQLPPAIITGRSYFQFLRPQLLANVVSQIAPRHLTLFLLNDFVVFQNDPMRASVFIATLVLGWPLAVYGVWRWLRAPFRLPVISVWWWLVIVAFTLAPLPAHVFYVLVLAPLPAVLPAGAFDGSLPRQWMVRTLEVWRWMYVAALLILTVLTGHWLGHRGGSLGEYGVAFEIKDTQARALSERLTTQPSATTGRVLTSESEELAGLNCHNVPIEVRWLVEWRGGLAAANLERFELCDAWFDAAGDKAYRWAIRERS